MSLNKRIGKNLVQYRSDLELTQEDLADKLGLTRGFISDLERGTKSVSVEVLARICKRTKMNPSQLLGV